MPAIYVSKQTGDWSSSSTWLTASNASVGTTTFGPMTATSLGPLLDAGISPQSFGGDKIIIAPGHVVTYDVSGCFGDESSFYTTNTNVHLVSSNAIVLSGGTLKASRLSSTELTARGNITIAPSGVLDWGTSLDPITAVNANITLHYMALTSAQVYSQGAAGINLAGPALENITYGNDIHINGAARTRNTTLTTSAVSATSAVNFSVINVANSDGWKVGDRLCIATELIPNHSSATIGVLSATYIQSMTGNSITISPGLNTNRSVGTCLSNFTSNINIKSFNPTYASYGIYLYTSLGNTIDINYVSFSGVGAGITSPVGWMPYSYTNSRAAASYTGSVLGFLSFNNTFAQIPAFTLKGVAMDNLAGYTQHYGLYINGKLSEEITVEDYCVYAPNSNAYAIQVNTSCFVNFKNCNVYRAGYAIMLAGSFPSLVNLDNCNFDASIPLGPSINGLIFNVTNSKIRASSFVAPLDAIQRATVKNSRIVGPNTTGLILQPNVNASGTFNFSNCLFSGSSSSTTQPVTLNTITKTAAGAANKTAQSAEFTIYQANNNPIDFRKFNYYHYSQADLTVRRRGITSYRMKAELANTLFYNYFTIPGVNNTPQRLKWSLRFDTAYGIANPPAIRFYGAGVDTTFTCGPTANVWQDFDISFTPTSTDDITIAVSCRSASTTGYVYLDGIPLYPYIQDVRHYGFVFDKNPDRTVSEHTTLTESQVSALATVSNLDYLYDAATYWSVTNPASSSYIDLVAIDGTNLSFLNNNLVINSAASTTFAYATATKIATIKSSAIGAGTNFDTLSSTGTITFLNSGSVSTDVRVRASNLDSELTYGGVDYVILYKSSSDAINSLNAGLSSTNGIIRYKYGATTLGVPMSGTVYAKWYSSVTTTSGINAQPLNLGTTALGNLVGFGTIFANFDIINKGIQKASKLIPHTININPGVNLEPDLQNIIDDQQIINEGIQKASKLIPHSTNI